MAIAYKESQIQGSASVGTYVTLYNTPASATAVVSTITICNTASTAATYRMGIAGSASTPGDGNWIAYGSTVGANDTIALTLGMSLAASRFIRVSSSASTVAFSAFVSEIS
jgi:hypothetical protein